MSESPLPALIAAILAVRDTPAVRQLLADSQAVCERDGESAGEQFAGMLLAGVRAYAEYESRLRPIVVVSGVGEVLGERHPPEGVPCWWVGHKVVSTGSKRRVKAMMGRVGSGSQVPTEVTHWMADGDKGWWKVPIIVQGDAAEGEHKEAA